METSSARNVAQIRKEKSPKRVKFVELAERRTINAIKSIRVVGKLGNPFAYEYDDGDVKKIVAALNREIEELKARFARKDSRAAIEFKL